MMWTLALINIKIATMTEAAIHQGTYGIIHDGIIGVVGDKIDFVGCQETAPENWKAHCQTIIDGQGKLLTPGLIDCHTHIVYGGNRSKEFEMRLEGATYEEIAQAGGGIISTVTATRLASKEALYISAAKRLVSMLREGVTTVEIKSGYGLTTDSETKMLEVAQLLAEKFPVQIQKTFLGAHAIPPEYKTDPDAYIDLITDEILPYLSDSGLVDVVDGFCEGIAFSPDQIRRVFEKAQALGLPVKLHADQLSDLNGGALVAEFGGLSADHLEYTNDQAVREMAKKNTVAVLLPGAFYNLKETKLPPMGAFRKYNVPIALATDSNPGSSPVTSLILMLNMACRYFGLTAQEAFAGVTLNAAKALGYQQDIGSIEKGKTANLALWDIESPTDLAYMIGYNPLVRSWYRGKEVDFNFCK